MKSNEQIKNASIEELKNGLHEMISQIENKNVIDYLYIIAEDVFLDYIHNLFIQSIKE